MRELYLADLKRLLRDRLLLITAIIGAALALMNPLLYYGLFSVVDMGELGELAGMVGINAKYLFFTSFLPGDNFGLIMPILISVIVCKDFSQGTVRNKIIHGKTRTAIFFSHFLSVATVMCALMLLQGLLTLGISLILFDYGATFTAAEFGYFMASVALELIVYLFVAALTAFVAVFAKNIGLCIFMLLGVSMVFSLAGSIFQSFLLFYPDGTLLPFLEFMSYANPYTANLIGTGTSYAAKDLLYLLCPTVLGGALFTALGALVMNTKDLK